MFLDFMKLYNDAYKRNKKLLINLVIWTTIAINIIVYTNADYICDIIMIFLLLIFTASVVYCASLNTKLAKCVKKQINFLHQDIFNLEFINNRINLDYFYRKHNYYCKFFNLVIATANCLFASTWLYSIFTK